jgi:hypothetical protein
MRAFTTLIALFAMVGGARAQDRTTTANDLKQLGLAYHNYVDQNNRGPKDADDLAPFFENSKKLLDALKTKRIEFYFGVGLNDLKDTGLSNTVIAYEKDAPSKGGLVLFGDGSVRKLSVGDFKKAPKAKKD